VNEVSPQIVSGSESKAVEFAIENDIAVIRFNRPKERNPLSVAVLNELDVFFSALDENFTAVIFTGSEDVFASGANLREISELKTESEIREFGLRGQNLMNKIAAAPCLTVAAVNGYCFGGAFDLALACKIRIAAPDAMFSHPGANLGIITGWGGTQRLPRIVGEFAALEMFLTAKRIDAREALRIGLVSEINDAVLPRALEIAQSTFSET
jgi:enoyl-CoA hydratase